MISLDDPTSTSSPPEAAGRVFLTFLAGGSVRAADAGGLHQPFLPCTAPFESAVASLEMPDRAGNLGRVSETEDEEEVGAMSDEEV